MSALFAITLTYRDMSFQLLDTSPRPVSRIRSIISPIQTNYSISLSYYLYCRVRTEVLFKIILWLRMSLIHTIAWRSEPFVHDSAGWQLDNAHHDYHEALTIYVIDCWRIRFDGCWATFYSATKDRTIVLMFVAYF